jgi:hypothetical protein
MDGGGEVEPLGPVGRSGVAGVEGGPPPPTTTLGGGARRDGSARYRPAVPVVDLWPGYQERPLKGALPTVVL